MYHSDTISVLSNGYVSPFLFTHGFRIFSKLGFVSEPQRRNTRILIFDKLLLLGWDQAARTMRRGLNSRGRSGIVCGLHPRQLGVERACRCLASNYELWT